MHSSASEARTCAVLRAPSDGSTGNSVSVDLVGILDTLDLPIVVLGQDCKVSHFNQAATDALGLTSTDVGRLASDIGVLSHLKEIEKLSAQVLADGAPCQSEIRNGDRWFLLRGAPRTANSGQIKGVVLTFTNITAFRASIAQAIYEREYTKAILNSVAQPLVVLDRDLRVQTGNRAFYTMFGVSRETTKGIPLCNLGNHEWKALPLWQTLNVSLDKSKFDTIEIEGDFPAIGRRTLLFDACRLARNSDAMILVALRDISDRKRQEEKLEATVAERTASLRETVGELESFSYSIAHDMRAPLRGMQGFANLLAEEHASQLDAQALDYLRRITASACRLDRLIRDVLNYSKIVKAHIAIEPVDLDRLTRDIIHSYPDWQPPKADIQIEGVLPKVLGNEAFLTQCISNLVSNAIKFVPAGTVPRVHILAEETITCPPGDKESDEGKPDSIHSGPLANGRASLPQVRLYFQDNGIGIAQDKHARIFRMFERIYPANEYEGTGIGLTIARKAAERMSGAIGFESQLGKGSKFWIQLQKA